MSPASDLWAQRPRAAPTTSYRLETQLDVDKHQLTGTGVVSWRNTSREPQSELYWHLYLNAFASKRTVFMRSPAGRGFRGGDMPKAKGSIEVQSLTLAGSAANLWPAAPHSPGDPDDATDIRVALPEPIAPGASLTMNVTWTAQLPEVSHRTGYADSFHMVAQWFPKLARLETDGSWSHFPFHRLGEFYADFGDYQVSIDAPPAFTIGATGELHSTRTLPNGMQRSLYQAQRVHDFAFTAWDGFVERRQQHHGVAIRSLAPQGEEASAAIELDYVRRGLDYFGSRYGRYPYTTLTVVHPPPAASDAGGMEYPTLITTGGRHLGGALGSRLGIRLLENLTVHELGHQWFYGLLASHEHDWPFLDEGLTTFAQIDAMQQWHGEASGAELLGLRIGGAAVSRQFSVGVASHGAVARPVTAFATGGDYANLVYRRTAALFETLARSYGRERLYRTLGRYAGRHRFAHPSPDDLLAAVTEEYGVAVAQQVRAALFDAAWIDYQLSEFKRVDQSEPGHHRASVLLRRLGTLRWPVDVQFVDTRGVTQRVRVSGQARHVRLQYAGDAPLKAALVDPDNALLLDANLSNNAVSEARAPSRRVAAHGAHLVQLLGTWVAP